MEVAQKIYVRCAEPSLQGVELEVVFAQAFEEGSYRLDVGRRIRVENDHIIEVGRHLCQTCYNFVNHIDEPAGRKERVTTTRANKKAKMSYADDATC